MINNYKKISLRILILFLLVISFEFINSSDVYAKTKKYTITYKLNKGINSTKNPNKYVKGKKTKLYKPVRVGYTFDGWYKDSKYTKKIPWISQKSQGKITLYAKWKVNTYKISYKTNYGTNHPDNVKKYTVQHSVPLYAPTREHYDFAGWYLDSNFTTKVKKIAKGTIGDITLYAKWTHSALNIQDESSYNMIWSWWYYPNAISYQDKQDTLYWTFTTNDGYTGIAARNNESGETKKTYLKFSRSSDDHNGAALRIMDDGKIMVVYSGGHNTDNELHIRISDNAEDISSFSKDILLTSSGKTCYGQILRSSDKYYVFYRVDNTNWAYRYSKDGVKWSDEVMFILSDIQYYIKAVPTTEDNIIRICMYSNPAKPDCSIRMGFLDTTDDMFYDNTNQMKASNISQKNVNVIIPMEANRMQRLLDVAITDPDDIKILYATFSKSIANQACMYKLYDNGNVIDICPGGNAIWKNIYQGGAAFIGTDKVVLAREENGFDSVELYNYTDGSFNPDESIYKEEIGLLNIRNARPVVDINGNYILWHRGFYDPLSYKNYLTEAKIYKMLDDSN